MVRINPWTLILSILAAWDLMVVIRSYKFTFSILAAQLAKIANIGMAAWDQIELTESRV